MSDIKPRIWILEDDIGSQFVYTEILKNRYELFFSPSIKEFQQKLQGEAQTPQLMIADLQLSDGSFLSFLGSNGGKSLPCPFLIVSSVDDVDSLNFCFHQGAIDYLTKPFASAELQVKVDKALRKHPATSGFEGTDIVLDTASLTIRRGHLQSPVLTPKELQIVASLMKANEGTLTRQGLVTQVWGPIVVSSKTFDVHLSNLRKKLAVVQMEILYCEPHSYRLVR
jgi:DNA-binding response OmpR family regulator